MIRALIAEDEWAARAKLALWLREQGDIEIVAQPEDGISAAGAILSHGPDVAFLDIQMPGLTGLEVAAQLEQSEAPLLVFVTAFDAHAIRAFELNAIDYILKPFDKDRLLVTLARGRKERRTGGLAPARSPRPAPRRAPASACWFRTARGCACSTPRRSSGLRPMTTTCTCIR
jgi:two-component system LytT family response regulator